jgi:hypothetical protein
MLPVLKIWLRGDAVSRIIGVLGLSVWLLAGCGVAPSLTAAQTGMIGKPAQSVATLAARQASRWASEAFLVGAEGYNLDAGGRLRQQVYSRWDFTFMSASRVGTLVVSVPGRGAVTSTLTAPVFSAVQPLYAGANWLVDSDKAASTARKALGTLAPDDRIDRISLALRRPDGRRLRPVWEIMPDLDQRSVTVDASSGALVD